MYNIIMSYLEFEWDENKNNSNKNKHKVSFEEGQTAFSDENAIIIHDPDHSEDEDRFILLGMSSSLKLLVVCHCLRDNDNLIRIISVRKADKRESSSYGG